MYSIEVDLAKRLGVSTAAVYDRLCDLCLERERNAVGYHDGRFWVRIPSKDFPKVFPFLSAGTVSKALRRLRDEDLVMVGHYDRASVYGGRHGLVNWYTIT